MAKSLPNLKGQKIYRWTVLEFIGRKGKHNTPYWLCKCECGTIKEVSHTSLVGKKSQSCGCLSKEVNSKKLKDLTGQKFGRLTVIERAKDHVRPTGARRVCWLCKCECGNMRVVESNLLIQGMVKSCGCLFANRHVDESGLPMSKTRLYRIWSGVKRRCYSKDHKDYKYCGAKGVIMCDEWKNNFKSFQEWSLKNGYAEGLTIDRIDTFGNYEPSNCRWITIREQQTNRRTPTRMAKVDKDELL